MVIQRTIESLRERPHDERRAVAFGVSVTVMFVLLVTWGFAFFHNAQPLDTTGIKNSYDQVVQSVQNTSQAAHASGALEPVDATGWVSQLPIDYEAQAPETSADSSVNPNAPINISQ